MKRKLSIILAILIILGIGGFFYNRYLNPKNEVENGIQKSILKTATTENMVLVPAGTFLMGREDREGWSPMANPQIFNDELPSHEVYLDAFYIDKYEVTNRQFKEFVDATGYVTDAERAGGSSVIVPADQADDPLGGNRYWFKMG